jgi:predicted nucleotidyltransferase
MRLTPEEVSAIKAATRLTFGSDAIVRLFGSRVDDRRRGGDIDLHVEAEMSDNMVSLKSEFMERLFARIDEQRVDLVLTRRGSEPAAIERIAYRDGIVL